MASSSPLKPAGFSISGIAIAALVVTLVAGAVLVRLVDVRDSLLDDERKLTEATSTTGDETSASSNASTQGLALAGQDAPDFTLLDLDGQPVSLGDWQGKPVLINFWATWCGPCEIEMPTIQSAYKTYQEDGLIVLAVAVEDSVTNVRRFFDKHNLTFKPLFDDGTASRAYQVFGLPTSVFVGSDGKITDVHAGVLTKSRIEKYLARALSQE